MVSSFLDNKLVKIGPIVLKSIITGIALTFAVFYGYLPYSKVTYEFKNNFAYRSDSVRNESNTNVSSPCRHFETKSKFNSFMKLLGHNKDNFTLKMINEIIFCITIIFLILILILNVFKHKINIKDGIFSKRYILSIVLIAAHFLYTPSFLILTSINYENYCLEWNLSDKWFLLPYVINLTFIIALIPFPFVWFCFGKTSAAKKLLIDKNDSENRLKANYCALFYYIVFIIALLTLVITSFVLFFLGFYVSYVSQTINWLMVSLLPVYILEFIIYYYSNRDKNSYSKL
jgi:hypothetical protein